MSEAPLSILTPKEISETISIEQNNTKYSLHITSIGETLTFMITFSEDLLNKVFVRILALKEIPSLFYFTPPMTDALLKFHFIFLIFSFKIA